MNNKNLEKLIEQYKREMLSYSRRSTLPPEPPSTENPQKQQRSEMVKQQFTEPETRQSVSEKVQPVEVAIPVQQGFNSIPSNLDDRSEVESDNNSLEVNRGEETVLSAADSIEALRARCAGYISGEVSASEIQRESCRNLETFLTANTGKGRLRTEVYAANRAYGIPNARVTVSLPVETGNITLFNGLTDIDGITPTIELPAPPKERSLTPDSNGAVTYAGYTVAVEHPSFTRAVFTNVPVFDSILSIQPVELIAKAEGTDEPAPIYVGEKEMQFLDGVGIDERRDS